MPVDPVVARYLTDLHAAGLPPMEAVSPVEAREQMRLGTLALGTPDPIFEQIDRSIPGPAGDIPVRISRPRAGLLPGLIFFHGGGWVVGSIDSHDGLCRSLANAADVAVISVEYRLAPEHRFPAAIDDATAATLWLLEHGHSWGIDPARCSVCGDSAGGNLAAVVPQDLRRRGIDTLRSQVLLYPVCDHDFETPSYRDNAHDYMLTRDAMLWFWDQYLGPQGNRSDPRASPLRANDLRGLPPALVITAEFDPLRDEAERYADRLREAGVAATLSRYEGMIHGFTRRTNLFPQARESIAEIASFLRQTQA